VTLTRLSAGSHAARLFSSKSYVEGIS